jgi:SAM-dependent methyltransferase
VLDVGTGRGGFVQELVAELKDYDEIIGIDIDADIAAGFAERLGEAPRVRFQQADAMALPFDDGSFDTVSVAGSLHHVTDPSITLQEMMGVLRPGGTCIVYEMYRDGQTEAQMTHVLLHHWWAAVDQTRGTPHRETYTRAELMDLIRSLGLSDLRITEEGRLDEDSKDPDRIASLEPGIDTYLRYAAGHPDLVTRGEELRERLHAVGLHWSTTLLAIGQKREV